MPTTPDRPSSTLVENMRAEMQNFVDDVLTHGGGKVTSIEVIIGFSDGELLLLFVPPPKAP